MKYIVPEYYKHFKCKCGECRNSCCDRWAIRISRQEYYRLLGLRCSDELRTRLDCALIICSEPGVEYYAQISTDWRGICKLHREDGLCALQAELGENNLPEVCRLYPRNTKRLTDNCECSCSNSCEEVVELLMDQKAPLQFEEIDLPMDPEFKIDVSIKEQEYCKKSISIIRDRSLPLPERFITLANFLNESAFLSKKSYNRLLAFQLLHELNQYFEDSISIGDYCRKAQYYYCSIGKETLSETDLRTIAQKYDVASEHLDLLLPDWQILFEQLIVNHMFYNNFPYTGHSENAEDSFMSLVMMYSFLRFHIVSYLSDKTAPDNLVDLLAAMFRVIEHSNFKDIAVNLIQNQKTPLQECVPELLCV